MVQVKRAPFSLSARLERNESLSLSFIGSWKSAYSLPDPAELHQLEKSFRPQPAKIKPDVRELKDWDSGLLNYLVKLRSLCRKRRIILDTTELSEDLRALLSLAVEKPESRIPCPKRLNFVESTGKKAQEYGEDLSETIEFIGELGNALSRFLQGKARLRSSSIFTQIQRAGPDAFPIVTLISILVGLILSFIGTVQLTQFGAQIYVANLVAIGMTREMGAVMAGVILAGRTGAAYAAEIGSMQANEEVDALKTLGLSPIEFLVLPRILALMLMMPLLTLYADLLGILGGASAAYFGFDISPRLFWDQALGALKLSDILFGVLKSIVFGTLVAAAGCLKGMYSGRDSASVGRATTSAVVTGIVLIVVTDAIFSILAASFGF